MRFGAAPDTVTAPPVEPYGYGLLSVAALPDSSGVRVANGVQYEPLTCTPAQTTRDACITTDRDGNPLPTPGELLADPGVPLVEADPLTLYAGFRCSAVGRSHADMQERARQALRLGEQRGLERAFWTGEEGNRPRLADPDADLLAVAPQSPVRALGLLEGYLGERYPGRGVIHIPRGLVPALHGNGLLKVEGDEIVTLLGTRVAAGGGYPNTGPDGAVAGANTGWAYATGQVAVWRGPELELAEGQVAAAMDRTTNEVNLIVERQYAVGRECALGAVPIALT